MPKLEKLTEVALILIPVGGVAAVWSTYVPTYTLSENLIPFVSRELRSPIFNVSDTCAISVLIRSAAIVPDFI